MPVFGPNQLPFGDKQLYRLSLISTHDMVLINTGPSTAAAMPDSFRVSMLSQFGLCPGGAARSEHQARSQQLHSPLDYF